MQISLSLVRPQDQDIASRLLARATWNENGCLIWGGAVAGRYGTMSVKKWAPPGRIYLHQRTHRIAYELFVGPIPAGTELDHLCHTRSGCADPVGCPHRLCLNPAHLEPVTHTENVLRGTSPSALQAQQTHCFRDHEFTVANTYVIPSTGGRVCRTCRADWREQNRDRVNASRREARQLVSTASRPKACCEFHDRGDEPCAPDELGGYCCDNCPTLASVVTAPDPGGVQ